MASAMLIFAGLMGAAGIVLTAASAHGASGTGLDSAGYLLLLHGVAVIGGVALLHQSMLSRIAGLIALCCGGPGPASLDGYLKSRRSGD